MLACSNFSTNPFFVLSFPTLIRKSVCTVITSPFSPPHLSLSSSFPLFLFLPPSLPSSLPSSLSLSVRLLTELCSDSPFADSPGGEEWLLDKSASGSPHASDFNLEDALDLAHASTDGSGGDTNNQLDFSLGLDGTPAPIPSTTVASVSGTAAPEFSLDYPTTPAVPASLRMSALGDEGDAGDVIGQVMAETPIPAVRKTRADRAIIDPLKSNCCNLKIVWLSLSLSLTRT